MVKHSLSARSRRVEGVASAHPSPLRHVRKLAIRHAKYLASHGMEEKQIKFPEEHSESNESNQGVPGSSDNRRKPMSSELASMLGGRVMQLKLNRVSLEPASGAVWKPECLSAPKLRSRHASGGSVIRPLKPKTSSGASSVSSSPVEVVPCRRKRQTRRGIRSMPTRRANASKKCNIVKRERSFSPSGISTVEEATGVTAVRASVQRTSQSTTRRVLESAPSATARRRDQRKESAVSLGSHGRHLVDSNNKVLHAGSDLDCAVHPGQEIRSQRGQRRGVNSKDKTDVHSMSVVAAEGPTVSAKAEEVTCDRSLSSKHADGKTARPVPQRPIQRRNRAHLKGNRVGRPKRRAGRPRKHPVPDATSSEDTGSPSKALEPPVVEGQSSLANSSRTEIREDVSDAVSDDQSRIENGNASQVTRSGQQKDSDAPQTNVSSSGLPMQAGNASGFPFKTEAMAVIYPCEALSVHLPSEALAPTTEQETSAGPGLAHDGKDLLPRRTRRCWVENDGKNQEELHTHVTTSQEERGMCFEEQVKTEVHWRAAADIQQQTLKQTVENSSQLSPALRADPEVGGRRTPAHRGSVAADAGDKPSEAAQEVSCRGGGVRQVKRPLLAVAPRRKLVSQSRRVDGTGTTLSPVGRRAAPAEQHDAQRVSPESAAQEETLNQESVAQEPAAVPSGEGVNEKEPPWMGRRSSSPTSNFRGFMREDLLRGHTVDLKANCPPVDVEVHCPLVVSKDCEDGGPEKSEDAVPPTTAPTAAPSTPSATAGLERHRCDHCKFESSSRARWENHVRRRHSYLLQKKKHACEKCSYSSKYLADLKAHRMTHTGEKPCPCSVCGKRFTRKSALNVHMLIHTTEKTFVCDTCGNAYRTALRLKYHQKVHTEEKSYRCDVCGMMFRQQDKLNIHSRKHTGEKPFRCTYCDKCFSFKTSLVHHIRTHTGEKPYRCDICGKTFCIRANLTDHAYSHQEERNFKCDYCEKSFKAKKFLVTHMKIHTGEKPLTCRFCDKRFLRQSYLNIHMRIHTGEKPFSCEICGKSFKDKKLLKDHFRTHTGEKPIKCETCGTMFRYMSNLRTHTRHFHGDVKRSPVPASS